MTTVTFCRECEALDSIVAVRDEEMCDEGQTGGVYRCSDCGHQFGVWLDAGQIDLGIIRDSVLIDKDITSA